MTFVVACALASLAFTTATVLLLASGCSRDSVVAPKNSIALSVRVVFEEAGQGAAAPAGKLSAGAAVGRVVARAFEIHEGEAPLLRAEGTADLAAGEQHFQISLAVPPADDYLVRVEAIGTRETETGTSAEGTVFEGEGEVRNLQGGASATVDVLMHDIVPSPRLVPNSEAPLRVVAVWPPVWGAQVYRILEHPSGLESVTAETTFTPGAGEEKPISASYRIRAELLNGTVSAFSESLDVVAAAACSLSTASLDFGVVDLGSTSDRSFTIHSIGNAPLSGTVCDTCGALSIIDGAGPFTLAPGESRTVQLRFAPVSPGGFECSVTTGTTCGAVACTGTGRGVPLCALDPGALDFGTVLVGSAAARSFTIRNDGTGPLDGHVASSCEEFIVLSGDGAFTLPPGGSRQVSVSFAPTSAGEHRCALSTGTAGCSEISCSGLADLPAACEVSPASLDFGTVVVGGEAATRRLVVRNTGGGSLAGTLAGGCGDFRVEGGPVSYALAADESLNAVVWFVPSAPGPSGCSLDVGADCGAVPCSGVGYLPPACTVTPQSLTFGGVGLGDTADRTLTLRNDGGDVLEGTVTSACSEFQIVGGTGAYSLGPGASHDVTVRFQPSAVGTRHCTVLTGSNFCSDVPASGEGLAPCDVSPTSLDFGSIYANATVDKSFTIRNTGTALLSGTVSENCAYYSIVGGAGTYALQPNQSRVVTVRYAPTAAGTHACTVDAGSEYCAGVSCTGQALSPCLFDPASLDFGPVSVGSHRDLTFTIVNEGTASFSGTVSEACAEYSILSGGGSYTLTPGGVRRVTVRFQPAGTGTRACVISTGALCGNIPVTGVGTTPSCSTSPSELTFETYEYSPVADQSFTILNTGSGLLTGSVTIPSGGDCSSFALVGGSPASYALAPGERASFTVHYQPQSTGASVCAVDSGAPCGLTLNGYNSVIGLRKGQRKSDDR